MIKNYSDIRYKKTKDGYLHNLEGDFAYFALWKSARPYREKIRDLLSGQFEILLETEIVWSEKYFHHNANRIYEAPVFLSGPMNRQSIYTDKIGGNRFILFVVRDPKPRYNFAISVSKKVELSNLNIINAKYKMRDWIQKDTGARFGVHSTNNVDEFFVQVPLLLGTEIFEALLKGEKQTYDQINKDLEGAGGWKSYKEVFRILNLTNNYLVLRNFETLPDENKEKDIDFLTDNYQRLASVLGIRQSMKRPYKGLVMINGEEISLDLRFVGDKYYDTSWQKDMLDRKVLKKGLFIPGEDDYFFSLLFHCKVQKSSVKEKYYGTLADLAKRLHFSWYQSDLLSDDKAIGEILNGYFNSQGYYYENPLDAGVYRNRSVIKYLQKNNVISAREILTQKAKYIIKRILPDPFVAVLKKVIKK